MNSETVVISIVLTTLVILVLIAGIAIVFFIAGRQKIKQQVELAETRLRHEQDLRQAEIEVGESIMEDVGQELHDNIGQRLTYMRLALENCKLDDPALEEILQPLEGHLADAAEELSLLSRSMNTEFINNLGLTGAMQMEVKRLTKLNRHNIVWEPPATAPVISNRQQLMAFRIFQEMLHNIAKHSRCKNITIHLSDDGGFCLHVTDDGRGFDAAAVLASPKASGLRNMVKRASVVGMQCTIESSPGNGCSYLLRNINHNQTIA